MPTIFISYRRADSANITGRLYDRLVERYGRASVFKDVDSIPPGARFADYIAESIQASDVALVMIGPRWLDASAGFARRRLDDPNDFVRLEVETALKLSVPVIPVLVDGASLPPARRLPASLRPLLQQNAVVLRADPDFTHDFERLAHAIDYWQGQPRREPQTPLAPPIPSAGAPAGAPVGARPSAAKAASRAATAVAKQIGIAARQKSARQQRDWRFRRGAQALGGVAFALALVVTLVAVLHGLNPDAGSGSSPGAGSASIQKTASVINATTTALAIRGQQPFTGLGPCDKNPAEQYNCVTNRYFWNYERDRVTCVGGTSARLTIAGVNVNYSYMSFDGLPYYGDYASFPSDFTVSMTIAFDYTASDVQYGDRQYDCATVGWGMTSESSDQWIDSLYVCQDSSWHLHMASGQAGKTHPFALGRPLVVKITVTAQTIGVSLDGTQVLSATPFVGSIQSLSIALWDNTPGHSITVSNFTLTPSAA